jgi:hypothetical protein
MATVKLHTPMHRQDNDTTTDYEAGDIIHIVSVVGDDEGQGTHFYLRGISEKQFCVEPAKEVKQLVATHKDTPQQPVGGNQLHFHGPLRGNVVQTAGNGNRINVDVPKKPSFWSELWKRLTGLWK